jgi:hypothetical protein
MLLSAALYCCCIFNDSYALWPKSSENFVSVENVMPVPPVFTAFNSRSVNGSGLLHVLQGSLLCYRVVAAVRLLERFATSLPMLALMQLWVHIILNAFVMVVLSTIMLSPRKLTCLLHSPTCINVDSHVPQKAAYMLASKLCVVLPAVILFVLGFAGRGFNWVHCAVFSAMIASTDAVSTTAILKQGEAHATLILRMYATSY